MERFVLERSKKEAGHWVVTDTEFGIVVRFKEHHFNDTQKATAIKDLNGYDMGDIARAMRELGDWMAEHHIDIVF